MHGAVFVQVEVWLNRVLDTMRATVRHEMTEAVAAYEEKPREQWLFDYPAQVFNSIFTDDLDTNSVLVNIPSLIFSELRNA